MNGLVALMRRDAPLPAGERGEADDHRDTHCYGAPGNAMLTYVLAIQFVL
jgi:hypothetical protein